MPPEPNAGFARYLSSHPSLLAWLYAQSGAARWGISGEEFAADLLRSAARHFAADPPAGEVLEAFLRGLHLEDLALACALRRGSEPAWEEFMARYRPVLYAAARAIISPGDESRARELADSLYAELYGIKAGADGKVRSLLEYYHGRSKLSTWLRAVLAQRHVDTLRASQRTVSLDDEANGEARPAPIPLPIASNSDPDPDRQALLPHLRRAVSLALAGLAPADRLLLSLYYVEGLTLAQIGRLHGVHEGTASRHLDRIRRELREAVERTLATGETGQGANRAAGGLSPAQVELCFRYAVEDWPFDLRHELKQEIGPAVNEEA